jgi:hypothetical protein
LWAGNCAVLYYFGDQIESFNTWVLDAARAGVDRL